MNWLETIIAVKSDNPDEIMDELNRLKDQVIEEELDEIITFSPVINDKFDSLSKSASVTFTIQDAHKIAQPKTISDIANMMYSWAEKNVPSQFFSDEVTRPVDIDGLSPHEKLGTVNWYISPDVDMRTVMPYVRAALEDLAPFGIKGKLRQDQSKMYPESKVWRVDITQNETSNFTSVPEVNINQVSATFLLSELGFQENYDGEVSAQELKSKIQALRTRSFSFPQNWHEQSQSPSSYWRLFGIDENRAREYFSRYSEQRGYYLAELDKIADYALSSNNSIIVWH